MALSGKPQADKNSGKMTPPQPVNTPGGEQVGIPGAPARADGFSMGTGPSFKPPDPAVIKGGDGASSKSVASKGTAAEQGSKQKPSRHVQGPTIKGGEGTD